MHNWPYATPDAPLGPASNAPHGPLCLGLVRWLVLCAAVLVSSCRQAGVLDPQGPIAAQELLLLINSTAIMLVVVVPVGCEGVPPQPAKLNNASTKKNWWRHRK